MADWQQLQARLPLLDQSRLMRLEQELGAEVQARLLALFVEDGQQQGSALRQAFADEDYALMARYCHSLKSACGSYGALRCQFLSEKLERACRELDTDRIASMMVVWQQALAATLDEIAGRLQR